MIILWHNLRNALGSKLTKKPDQVSFFAHLFVTSQQLAITCSTKKTHEYHDEPQIYLFHLYGERYGRTALWLRLGSDRWR